MEFAPMHPKAQSLLRVEDLAELIHKSAASIRSDACRNPQALPPICRLPGTKRLLWRQEDVSHWLERHVSSLANSPTPGIPKAPQRRRGRPTKAEQINRSTRRENARG